jgi:hypothetical protein
MANTVSAHCYRNTPVKLKSNVFLSAVKGHFSHPHGREWTNLTDHVTPLLAEIVGTSREYGCSHTYNYEISTTLGRCSR